jgi:hypothetical protein
VKEIQSEEKKKMEKIKKLKSEMEKVERDFQ